MDGTLKNGVGWWWVTYSRICQKCKLRWGVDLSNPRKWSVFHSLHHLNVFLTYRITACRTFRLADLFFCSKQEHVHISTTTWHDRVRTSWGLAMLNTRSSETSHIIFLYVISLRCLHSPHHASHSVKLPTCHFSELAALNMCAMCHKARVCNTR